jgi:hypothetical protein
MLYRHCNEISQKRCTYIESARLDPRLDVVPFYSSEQVHISIALVTGFLDYSPVIQTHTQPPT